MAELLHSNYFNESVENNMVCLMLDDSLASLNSVKTDYSDNINDEKKQKNKLSARKTREKKREDKQKQNEDLKDLEDTNKMLYKKAECLKLGIEECKNIIEKINYNKSVQSDQSLKVSDIQTMTQPIMIESLQTAQTQSYQVYNIPNSDLFGFNNSEKVSIEAESNDKPKYNHEYKSMFSQIDLNDLELLEIDLVDPIELLWNNVQNENQILTLPRDVNCNIIDLSELERMSLTDINDILNNC